MNVDTPSDVSPAELHRFLLDESPMVRDAVTFYCFESWASREELLPSILEAARRFGPEGARTPLFYCSRFPFTPASFDEALSELGRERLPGLERAVALAPLGLAAERWSRVRDVTSRETQEQLSRRRVYRETAPATLWQELETVARRLPMSGELEDEVILADLVEALAIKEREIVVRDRCRHLGRVEDSYLKTALIELAGARRVRELTGELTALLGSDDEAWAQSAREALARIDPVDDLKWIAATYPEQGGAFRFSTALLLRALKHRDAERCLRSFLETEDDVEVRGAIFDALRFHFTDTAAEMLREEIRQPTSFVMTDELKKALFVNARVRGRDDPEALDWARELEEMGEGEICFEISFLSVEDDELGGPLSEEPSPLPPAPPVNAVKTGRNQPCPCGGGKKFKKCCGQDGNYFLGPPV